MPSPFAVAATNKPALFEKHGSLIGQEVRMLGLNTTLAPVLDLRTACFRAVMTTPRRLRRSGPGHPLCQAFSQGLAQQGVLGCGKHFPGLGSGQVDSHHATPVIDQTLRPALARRSAALPAAGQAAPHGDGLACGLSAIPSQEPASISRYWITEILVRKIGYQGLILSDDMEMGGILNYTGIAEAAVRSSGGHARSRDLPRSCLGLRCLRGMLREAESSPAFARLLRRAAAKVRQSQLQL